MLFVGELVVLSLEILGVLLVAAGAGFAAGFLIGWAGLAITGFVILTGAALAARRQRQTAHELAARRKPS